MESFKLHIPTIVNYYFHICFEVMGWVSRKPVSRPFFTQAIWHLWPRLPAELHVLTGVGLGEISDTARTCPPDNAGWGNVLGASILQPPGIFEGGPAPPEAFATNKAGLCLSSWDRRTPWQESSQLLLAEGQMPPISYWDSNSLLPQPLPVWL